jgi:hypothetical protein
MRYSKGAIALGQGHDFPLLRQVVRSQFVTHSQLFEFMRRGGYERDRRVFDWRLRRLVNHGVVVKLETAALRAESIYTISPSGSLFLQGSGECFVPLPSPRGARDRELKVMHAVELNDLRLQLLRAGMEILWVGETEIRSRNELTPFGFAKDYDALVTVALDGRSARFALEYERTPKSRRHYTEIAKRLESERAVERILYLVPNRDLLSFVAGFFWRVELPLFFGLTQSWHEKLLDMPVLNPHTERNSTLREALR